MEDDDRPIGHWQWGAIWLAGAAATLILVARVVFGSDLAEAAAIGLLCGVIVFGLAYLANEKPVRR